MEPTGPNRKSAVHAAKFRSDPMFPRIERVVARSSGKRQGGEPIDVLVGMELLV
jgi:hypothetical protein